MIPDLSAIEYGRLRGFMAVASSLSFRRGAERLGIPTSALSQAIRALEISLGVSLLNRTTRSVALTEAGETLRSQLEAVPPELASALKAARRHKDSVTGTVRLHCSHLAANLIPRPALPAFHRRHPEVVVDVLLDDSSLDFVAGGFDAAIRLGEVIDNDLVALRLGPDMRQVAVAAPSYLQEAGTPETPHDLAEHACIRWRWPDSQRPLGWRFADERGSFRVEVSGPVVSNSREFCLRAALDGLGIAFAVEEEIKAHVAQGRLIRLFETFSTNFPGFHVCHPAQRKMAPVLRALIDALAAVRRSEGRPPADPVRLR